eukprot:CAMPEP_0198730328 /NCGR_PEP_ID=MMETSP1475-20131203/24068_1 /TAXON_ID= ORGANISM="Unidentified sp., Strain CCMP1999" /NCGR_SAMPLE_ID=MMETSP1475 /ASSEMBLY_ACC=CAM_ASM_001111 /LENGTH=144 /DNA_ID=CAMNT_0044493119 /DNA_START=805 /DNA_END=1236 /DNA_ORIENTATION=+
MTSLAFLACSKCSWAQTVLGPGLPSSRSPMSSGKMYSEFPCLFVSLPSISYEVTLPSHMPTLFVMLYQLSSLVYAFLSVEDARFARNTDLLEAAAGRERKVPLHPLRLRVSTLTPDTNPAAISPIALTFSHCLHANRTPSDTQP